MEWAGWLAGGAVVVLAVDRLGVWAERHGWLYWRTRRRGGMGEAITGPLVEAFHPAHRHVVQERERQRLEIQLDGRGEPAADGPGPIA